MKTESGFERSIFNTDLPSTRRLSQLTVDLVSLFRSAIERGGVDFIVDAEPDPDSGRSIFLSPELWEKVVFNLCEQSSVFNKPVVIDDKNVARR